MNLSYEFNTVMPLVDAVDTALSHIEDKVVYQGKHIFQITDTLWVCVCTSEQETHPLLIAYHPDESIEILGDTENFNIHQYIYKDLDDFASCFPYNSENIKQITRAIREKQNEPICQCHGCAKRCQCDVNPENTL